MLLFFGVIFLGLVVVDNLSAVTRNEGNISFNDAFYTFHLRFFGVRHKVKYHSDSERRNPLLPLHGLLFSICSKVSFIIHTHIDSIAHTTAFVNPSHHERTLDHGSAVIAMVYMLKLESRAVHALVAPLTTVRNNQFDVCSKLLTTNVSSPGRRRKITM